MQKIVSIIIAIITLGTISAVDMPPTTRLYLDRLAHRNPGLHRANAAESDTPAFLPMLLQIADDSVVDQLVDRGVRVYGHRLDIVAVTIPYDSILSVFQHPGVLYASRGGDLRSCLDEARKICNVNPILSGDSPHGSFDGSGVVVGISDIGFDHTHPAFRNRLVQLHHIDEYNAATRCAVTPAEIARWVTDDSTKYHASHVAGILAGSANLNNYDGVARGSDLIVTTSNISDVGIIFGIEQIINYARAQGKPAAINVSISNQLGAHDGTDLFARYISDCARDAVICFSAGNSGKRKVSAYADITSDAPDARVILNSLKSWNGFDISGMAEIWCDNDLAPEFAIGIYDMTNGQTVYTTPWKSGKRISEYIDDRTDPEWARYMTGAIAFEGSVSPLNGRYNIGLSYEYTTQEYVKDRKYARYYAELIVRPTPGTHIDMFSDGQYSYFDSVYQNQTAVGADGSINAMSVADGIISVGAYSSRNTAPALPEGLYRWDFDQNAMAEFSSYSTLPTIGRFPHFCAPGNMVVSAVSSAYLETHPDETCSASTVVDGKEYYWMPECGTSMASPFATGVIALWLQADPSLTSKEIIEIAQSTARRDFSDPDNPRAGAGLIDALAGLDKVIKSCPVNTISVDSPYLVRVTPDRHIEVVGTIAYTIHNLSGRLIDPSSTLSPGIYLLSLPSETIKIAVR